MAAHKAAQRYLSTRGGSHDKFSFEDVVLKGLASDGGLFIPEDIPQLPESWTSTLSNLLFKDLAFRIFSLYISPDEIPSRDLENIVERSYSSFRSADITPLVTLDAENDLHLLELFHGPTFAFKDVALQFLGNLFEYFLTRRNEKQQSQNKEHLTVIGATSGDTGSAAIYGLRGKKDVSVFMMHPKGKISPIQEAQMTTVTDANVHNLAVDGTFDDCQDFVKALFQDADINQTHKLAAVNSINWARILAQITYYFHAYALLLRSGRFAPGRKVRFVVPTGNFGDILAGYFAKCMGLPIDRLVIATNENDILHRFWQTGRYEKNASQPHETHIAHTGVRETLSPAMDILVSSNFERLLWFLAFEDYGRGSVQEKQRHAGSSVKNWLSQLKSSDGFGVEPAIHEAAKRDFGSERVSDQETLDAISEIYHAKTPAAKMSAQSITKGTVANGGYILDPHSAIGVAAARRSMRDAPPPETHHIALATAHPAKFSAAVEKALEKDPEFQFHDLLPDEFQGLQELPRRVSSVQKSEGLAGLRSLIRSRVPSSGA
ncbi:MAG: hypothetical protein Q9162_000170 [Coniocarpon cinnabarinum]